LFAGKNNITEYNITGAYLIMLVYRCLLTIILTWQSSCVIITNYNQKLFVQAYTIQYKILEGEIFGEITHSKDWQIIFWQMPKIELILQSIPLLLMK